jgi:hypothetical protein
VDNNKHTKSGPVTGSHAVKTKSLKEFVADSIAAIEKLKESKACSYEEAEGIDKAIETLEARLDLYLFRPCKREGCTNKAYRERGSKGSNPYCLACRNKGRPVKKKPKLDYDTGFRDTLGNQ